MHCTFIKLGKVPVFGITPHIRIPNQVPHICTHTSTNEITFWWLNIGIKLSEFCQSAGTAMAKIQETKINIFYLNRLIAKIVSTIYGIEYI